MQALSRLGGNRLNAEVTQPEEQKADGLCAIASEKDSLLFYMELLLDTKNEQTAQVLRAIISEEKRHLVDLQQLLEKTR